MGKVTQIHSSVRMFAMPDQTIAIAVVRSLDDMMQVISIRSQSYIAEQNCPWAEEFDNNDFCGTHLLLRKGGEPIGTLRLRFFSGFVKLERLAVLERFRNNGFAAHLVSHAIQMVARKGFGKIYIHAQGDAVSFWQELGFKPIAHRANFSFSGYSYIEMTFDFEPRHKLGLDTRPMVLNRPEGDWDRPGPLEGGIAGLDFAAND